MEYPESTQSPESPPGNSLFKISKKVRNEAFFESQMAMAGSNQSRFLEKLEKNKNSMKVQSQVLKIVYAFLLAFLPLIPLFTYFQIRSLLGLFPADSIIFVASLLFSIFFIMQFVYMLVIGITSVGGLLSGEVFNWLETLPIGRKDRQKIAFYALFRFFDIPLIVLVAAFPIIIGIATRNVVLALASLGMSIVNIFFMFTLLLLVSEKITRVLKGGGQNSKKATIVRMGTMLAYVALIMLTSLLLNYAISSVGTLFQRFVTSESRNLINLILSLIPFPFAPAYLISLASIPFSEVSPDLLATTLIGIALLLFLSFRMYRKVLTILHNVTSLEARTVRASKGVPRAEGPGKLEIEPRAPIAAFVRKDLAAATRDIQSFMFLLMPIIFPIIMVVSGGVAATAGSSTSETVLVIWVLFGISTVFSSMMLIGGLLGMEDSGASVLAALPVVPRDQAMAKLRIIITIEVISSLLPALALSFTPNFLLVLGVALLNIPFSLTLLLLGFEMYVYLFGKMKYKYTVEEVNSNLKPFKWAGIIIAVVGIMIAVVIVGFLLGFLFGIIYVLYLLLLVGGAGIVLTLMMFQRMFPKLSRKSSREER